MKKLYSISLICLLSFTLFAQYNNEDDYYDPNFKTINDSILLDNGMKKENKISSGLIAGSMFLNSKHGSFMSSYVAPTVNYKLSNNIRFSGGLMFTQNNFFGLKNNEINNFSTISNSTLLFIQGEYLLNKNIILRGSVVKDINNFYDNNKYNSYSIGMDYRLTENSSLRFDIQLSNSNNPFYNPTGFGNSFGNNHFFINNQ